MNDTVREIRLLFMLFWAPADGHQLWIVSFLQTKQYFQNNLLTARQCQNWGFLQQAVLKETSVELLGGQVLKEMPRYWHCFLVVSGECHLESASTVRPPEAWLSSGGGHIMGNDIQVKAGFRTCAFKNWLCVTVLTFHIWREYCPAL